MECPECGTFGDCFFKDKGDCHDYIDCYSFVCRNKECGYIDKTIIHAGGVYGNNGTTNCPYCGASCIGHQEQVAYKKKQKAQ